ncbi:hypothetical protein SOV_26150 [Sporomusa ovata DSM 2662]|uniref:Uncharacterized protein n=1 Tax=Sporomusa ovata TaxID=2378 RepID=A0A0U1L474_9FIRM|nr:hypothetical protein [Sporomusa ovata]EQB25928.1 hypothetical protein SOV_4c05950 [Sporomusa ovata DSM 2662]CQR74507.1 hypothetical protein SpAn4DRAFT_0969 [Sporomusa ovata]
MKHQQIEKLTHQLLDCGYYPYQIKQIISDAMESDTTTDTGISKEQLIINALKSYVEFGTKCKSGKI